MTGREKGPAGQSRPRLAPLESRPRCPRCGAKTWLVVARRPDGAYVSRGPIVVTASCGYSVRGAGRCRQPVALVLDGERAEYAFPPTFEALDGLTAPEIVSRYGPAAVWARDKGP